MDLQVLVELFLDLPADHLAVLVEVFALGEGGEVGGDAAKERKDRKEARLLVGGQEALHEREVAAVGRDSASPISKSLIRARRSLAPPFTGGG